MREVVFINNNTDRWKNFEKLLAAPKASHPDVLADLFIQITDDLSYARTFFPKSRATKYLNTIALRAHQQIYLNRKEKTNRLISFWTHEFPLLLFDMRRLLLYSFLIFAVALFIGIVSAANDDRFVRLILGDYYVNMTLNNIQNGDPMAVYKQANEVDMFLGITINNIRVMFNSFVLGIFASLGTVYVLFSNGIMLGSFQYFFFEHGVLYESILSIWIHGTIEIFCIVVSGAAGLSMGNAILFPGTYKRITALKRGAQNGLKTAVGLVPFIILAGFLEGFVTRHTSAPDVIRIGIIVASVALIVWYFFLYPRQLHLRLKNDFEKSIH